MPRYWLIACNQRTGRAKKTSGDITTNFIDEEFPEGFTAADVPAYPPALTAVAAAVIHYQGTVDELITFVFNLPTLSVLYKQAAYDALHQLKLGRGEGEATSPAPTAVLG